MKNITLTIVMTIGSFLHATAADHRTQVFAAGMVAGATSAGLMYAYYRENNAVKVEKIERIWRHVIDNVARTRPEDFSKILPAFKNFDVFAYELYDSLESRYTSWATPWNWFPSMRLAYKKATLLQILFKYLDILHYWHAAISGDSIERLGSAVCGPNYTVTIFVQELTKDMDKTRTMMKDVYCPFGDILYEHLRAIREIAMQSNAYRAENVRPIGQV